MRFSLRGEGCDIPCHNQVLIDNAGNSIANGGITGSFEQIRLNSNLNFWIQTFSEFDETSYTKVVPLIFLRTLAKFEIFLSMFRPCVSLHKSQLSLTAENICRARWSASVSVLPPLLLSPGQKTLARCRSPSAPGRHGGQLDSLGGLRPTSPAIKERQVSVVEVAGSFSP
jgi:hypothetical protein